MTSEWYYTTNKQQMGPVSWEELRHLATSGLLKSNDLVWTEGMPEWVKAQRQNGLFPDVPSPTGVSTKPTLDEPPPPPVPKSATRRRIDDELDERDDDEKRSRRRTKAAGSGAGMKVGLIIGGVLLVLIVLGCGAAGVIAIVVAVMSGGGADVPPGGATYNLVLGQGAMDERAFNFRAGQRVTVTVTTTRHIGPFQPDVDLFVIRRGLTLAQDVRIHPDCVVTFVAPATDTYILRVKNLGPGQASSRVNINFN